MNFFELSCEIASYPGLSQFFNVGKSLGTRLVVEMDDSCPRPTLTLDFGGACCLL